MDKKILFISAFLLIFSFAFGQLDDEDIQFSGTRSIIKIQDLGEVSTVKTFTVEIKNTGTNVMEIVSVSPIKNCSILVPETVLTPRESAKIQITLDPKLLPAGEFNHNFIVVTKIQTSSNIIYKKYYFQIKAVIKK